MDQTSLVSLSDIFHSAPAPAPQQTGFGSLVSTRSSRALQVQAVETFQRNSWGAVLAGSAMQYSGALFALGSQICEKYPGSEELCRPILETYTRNAAQQITQFYGR